MASLRRHRLCTGDTVRHRMHRCHCVLSYQITQGGPETADHLASGCCGNKLKRRKASCAQPTRRKRLADPFIPPNPSPKTSLSQCCPAKSLLPQALTAIAVSPSLHGATGHGLVLVACWVLSSRQLVEGRPLTRSNLVTAPFAVHP